MKVMTTFARGLRRALDIDQLLIFALLAVTVNQLGHYLSTFAPPHLWFIGYLQAIGIDLTIWRCSHWYRAYTGKKQRRIALAGLVLFLVISAWYNAEYYLSLPQSLGYVRAIVMGLVLPLSVAAVSYLYGVKDTSAFATDRKPAQGSQASLAAVPEPVAAVAQQSQPVAPVTQGVLVCRRCHRKFPWPSEYGDQRRAQNAMNAHTCKTNGHNMSEPYMVATLADEAPAREEELTWTG